ncbi:alpha-galactosidase 1-like [Silene latifolia]|uniref:alpha-galactosidase 1-like n=1 Tax=Silene latifolia TaxID=37657 RepID=UPI003D773845
MLLLLMIHTEDFCFLTALPKLLMGWNSWNHFKCNVTEKIVRQTADALVSTGLSKLGYKYVNIDDCWAELKRNSTARVFILYYGSTSTLY